MHDKLFDAGYITLSSENKVVVSDVVNADLPLKAVTDLIKGVKIHRPRKSPPKEEYLNYHRNQVFESFLKD